MNWLKRNLVGRGGRSDNVVVGMLVGMEKQLLQQYVVVLLDRMTDSCMVRVQDVLAGMDLV